MAIKKPETLIGPFAVRATGVINAEDGEQQVCALVSKFVDGPTELDQQEKPRTFNTIEQAEKWLNKNVEIVALGELDWEIITTIEALKMREDLELDKETKKFL